jgi:hypothetical protein
MLDMVSTRMYARTGFYEIHASKVEIFEVLVDCRLAAMAGRVEVQKESGRCRAVLQIK